MSGRQFAGSQPVFEVHQARDGEPAFDARGARCGSIVQPGLEAANPEVEGRADPYIEQQERDLETTAN